jgi:hypothetical protein
LSWREECRGKTYCYRVVVFDVKVVIVVEEESVVLAVAFVGHGFARSRG